MLCVIWNHCCSVIFNFILLFEREREMLTLIGSLYTECCCCRYNTSKKHHIALSSTRHVDPSLTNSYKIHSEILVRIPTKNYFFMQIWSYMSYMIWSDEIWIDDFLQRLDQCLFARMKSMLLRSCQENRSIFRHFLQRLRRWRYDTTPRK